MTDAAPPRVLNCAEDLDVLIDIIGRIASGDFGARCVLTNENDQVEALRLGINMLAEEIEMRVNDLEKMNGFFVDRELIMAKLKRRIASLEDALQKAGIALPPEEQEGA